MNEAPFGSSEIAALLNDFLLNDDIAGLAADVGRLLGYPLLVIMTPFMLQRHTILRNLPIPCL